MRGILRFFGPRQFWGDTRGVAWIYVTITASALFGFAALVIDFSRVEITHTLARSAAEAAALAGASQLDGTSDAITRALNAAYNSSTNTPLTQNAQKLGATPGTIKITGVRFLDGLPAGDPTLPNDPSVLDSYVVANQNWSAATAPDAPFNARFIEVTTQQITVNNTFIQILGGGATSVTKASAVAGFTQVLCRRAPLAICNPMEDPTAAYGTPAPPLDISKWKGREVLVKASGPSASWTPGTFSLVDMDGSQSTPAIWKALAESEPDICINARVNLKPGSVTAVNKALNTRFDSYETPFPGGINAQNDPKMFPAPDVVKGWVYADPANPNACNLVANTDPTVASMKLPRDEESRASESVAFTNAPLSNTRRFGNGTWDCETYWTTMHSGEALPSGCTHSSSVIDSDTTNDMTRYDLYKYEIAHTIPNHTATGGENGDVSSTLPNGNSGMCYTGSGTPTADRRIVYFAVVNCIELGPLNGNSAGDLPVTAFIKGFLTERVEAPSGDPEIVLEIEDIARPGGEDGVLHDIVQLYR